MPLGGPSGHLAVLRSYPGPGARQFRGPHPELDLRSTEDVREIKD
jgi:hypothetical protein